MKNKSLFVGKTVLVLGLAKSGLAVGKLLHTLGATVIVNDFKSLEENPNAKELTDLGIEVICGGHPLELLERDIAFIVKNPGIPYSNSLINLAVEKGISVVTEIEIASLISPADMIAITGSNGKTTTTTLIYEMLKNSGRTPLLAGNIGTVACEVASAATQSNILVTEVSSFQLMGTEKFHPKIAVFLNLFDAHLDYHGTKDEYGKAKKKIFANLTEDDSYVINEDDPIVVELSENVIGKRIAFSLKKKVEGAYLANNAIFYFEEKIIDLDQVVLPGEHNLQNILAAICAAKLAGAKTEQIISVLTSFSGVVHRTQYVATVNDRKFYNDSKATNMLATKVAVAAFTDPIILLAGGLDRGNAFDDLIPTLKKVKGLVLYGQTAEKIALAANKAGMMNVKIVENVDEAVVEAFQLSLPGDVILLSPACASWDQFKTFEDRGDAFISAVEKLKN